MRRGDKKGESRGKRNERNRSTKSSKNLQELEGWMTKTTTKTRKKGTWNRNNMEKEYRL
jgi:hypothetical protein